MSVKLEAKVDYLYDSGWLSIPISQGRSVCAWAESGGWVNWLGGYEAWVRDKPPEFNQWRFVRDCEELTRATMLEL